MATETATETARIPRINDDGPRFFRRNDPQSRSIFTMDRRRLDCAVFASERFHSVCTTELGYMAGLQPEFTKRNTKIIGLSVDPVTSHGKWAADIEETQGHKVNYPMIGDPELKIAKLYGMLPAESGTTVPRAALRRTMRPCVRSSSLVRTRR